MGKRSKLKLGDGVCLLGGVCDVQVVLLFGGEGEFTSELCDSCETDTGVLGVE